MEQKIKAVIVLLGFVAAFCFLLFQIALFVEEVDRLRDPQEKQIKQLIDEGWVDGEEDGPLETPTPEKLSRDDIKNAILELQKEGYVDSEWKPKPNR